jgi:aspartyl-tRNA(Asn)/glutamyl-tRNA(Gln) amidotransferase subunit A
VAAGEALGAIGTDTGGSIRIPSACCGVTGFKPTYDLVSRAGVIQLSSSFDHVGPIARTVEDCTLLLDEIVAVPHNTPYAAQLEQEIAGVRLGILGGPWADEVDDDVLACFQEAAAVLGHDLPTFARSAEAIDQLFDTYVTIQSSEAVEYHLSMGWYPDRSERYTPQTRHRLEKSEQISAIDLIRAMRHRNEFIADWENEMNLDNVDVYLAPTIPIPAPPVEAVEDPDLSPTLRGKLLRLTFPFNMMGMPVLSVPCGFTPSGMPVGMQIIARRDQDALVLRIGHALQQRTNWHQHLPPI